LFFQEQRQDFRRKLAKIAENSDLLLWTHNTRLKNWRVAGPDICMYICVLFTTMRDPYSGEFMFHEPKKLGCLIRFSKVRPQNSGQFIPGANPTTSSYNASDVKIYNATSSLCSAFCKQKNSKKSSSLLQRWRCSC
jgi:hypothetical protein